MHRSLPIALLLAAAACSPTRSVPGNNETAAADADIRQVAAVDPADAKAARAVATRYFDLIAKRDFAAARKLWGHDGADSGGDAKALASAYARYKQYEVTIGEPTAVHTTDGTDYVNVAVSVEATMAEDGKTRHLEGPVMLRRSAGGDARAADDSRGWAIWGIDIRSPH